MDVLPLAAIGIDKCFCLRHINQMIRIVEAYNHCGNFGKIPGLVDTVVITPGDPHFIGLRITVVVHHQEDDIVFLFQFFPAAFLHDRHKVPEIHAVFRFQVVECRANIHQESALLQFILYDIQHRIPLVGPGIRNPMDIYQPGAFAFRINRKQMLCILDQRQALFCCLLPESEMFIIANPFFSQLFRRESIRFFLETKLCLQSQNTGQCFRQALFADDSFLNSLPDISEILCRIVRKQDHVAACGNRRGQRFFPGHYGIKANHLGSGRYDNAVEAQFSAQNALQQFRRKRCRKDIPII